ncbi:MAG TPA: flagellar basal body rod protein FlgC [Candidatus Binataceae bacterium]|nr:flagellar basal body rod protein FlgC [Candidatus Binataceae bacterium]
MPIQGIVGVASSALSAQSLRLTLIAQNLANADSVSSPEGGPYQRRIPVFEATSLPEENGESAVGVKVAAVLRDQTPPRVTHDPSNPLADAEGNVSQPSINPVLEMVDMMQASRSYEANLSTLQTAHNVALKTLDLLK